VRGGRKGGERRFMVKGSVDEHPQHSEAFIGGLFTYLDDHTAVYIDT
jgi:hypothetical protein